MQGAPTAVCTQSKQEVAPLDPDIYQDSGPGLAHEMICLHEPISGLHHSFSTFIAYVLINMKHKNLDFISCGHGSIRPEKTSPTEIF